MNDCCREYLANLDHLDKEWTAEAARLRALPAPTERDLEWAASYESIVFGDGDLSHPPLRDKIERGVYGAESKYEPDACCPWDPRYFKGIFADSYRSLTRYFNAGGRVSDLTFGPIEVVPEELLG